MAKLTADANKYRKELSQEMLYYETRLLNADDEFAAEALGVLREEYDTLIKNPDNYES